MITCSRCGKDNQRHYKFCLGCGAKLEAPRPAPEAKPALDPTRESPRLSGASPAASGTGPMAAVAERRASAVLPAEVPATELNEVIPATIEAPAVPENVTNGRSQPASAQPASAQPASAQPAASTDLVACSHCGKMVSANFAFCGACGSRLDTSHLSAAASMGTMQLGSSLEAAASPRGHLTLIRPDGTEGGVHPLQNVENLIGRGQGSLFDADPYLSPRHAEISFSAEGMVLRDLRSLNGVFVKITQEEELQGGDIFRIGQELLRFDFIEASSPVSDGTEVLGTPNPGYWGRLSVIVGRDVDGPAFPLFEETITLGRERGDVQFPEDGYVSGSHAQIALRDSKAYLSDRGSSNGTFLRIRGGRTVPAGTLLLMGQQLFRASYR